MDVSDETLPIQFPGPRRIDPLLLALARARVAVIAIQEALVSPGDRVSRVQLAEENLTAAIKAIHVA